MRNLWIRACGLLALVLFLPAQSEGQKKKDKKEAPRIEAATAQDYAALAQAREFEARLLGIEPSTRTLHFQVEIRSTEQPSPQQMQQMQDYLRQQQQLTREYEKILQLKNAAQRQKRLEQFWLKVQLQMARGNLKAKAAKKVQAKDGFKNAKEYELLMMDEIHVGRRNLPVVYDDKGYLKEYTAEEQEKLRDSILPGYKAKFEDLEPGQLLRLYLVQPAKATGTAKAGAQAADAANTPKTDNRPQIRMILIESEADLSSLPMPKTPPKKKKG